MTQVVWVLYYREMGFDRLIVDRQFGVFSSQEAVLRHMEWRKRKGLGTGPGFFVNPTNLDESDQPAGYTKDVVYEDERFTLVDQTVARELAKELAPDHDSLKR